MATGLVYSDGTPIPASALRRQDSGPTVIGVRPAVSYIEAAGITPWQLATIMYAADHGNSLAWQQLAAEIERRDLHYLGVLGTRKRVISQIPITVKPASDSAEHKKHAAFVEDWLDTDILAPAIFDMLDAIGKGWSVTWIDWKCEPGNYTPIGLEYRPQRFFEIDYEDGDTVLLRVEAGTQPLNTYEHLVHRHPSYSGLTIQSGLTRAAAWCWMFKTFTMRDWAQFVANYGAPVRLGRYGPEASNDDRDVLWQAVSAIAGDCAAIIPKSMEVEFVQPANTTAAAELYQKRCDWLDAQMSKLVLGQTATTDASPGSHAAGRTHRLVQEDIERADCMWLGSTLNRQLVHPMIAYSFGEQDKYPRLLIGRPDETPIEQVTAALQWMGPQGLRVKAEEVRSRLNFTEPDDDDEVVGGRVAPPPAPTPAGPGQDDGAPEEKGARQLPPTEDPPQQTPPENKPPPVAPDLHSQIGRLVLLHTQQQGPELIERMTLNLANRAGQAIGAMTEAVRAEVEAAKDFPDLQDRLDRLKLDPEDFAAAMQNAMTIAELAGQASLLDQIRERGR